MTKDLCPNCKHYWGDLSCPAFPNRIPDSILVGGNNHRKVHPDQEGDFTFEEREADE